MPRPVVINHGGNRDGYQLAQAFSEADLLSALITDCYIPLDHGLLRFAKSVDIFQKRYCPLLKADKVKVPFKSALNATLDHLFHIPGLARQRDKQLSEYAFNYSSKQNVNMFLYSYTAFEAFERIRKEKLPQQRFLFQLHPSPEYIRQILLREMERYPFAAASLEYEHEMKDDHNMNRLKAEPQLADFIFTASSFTKKSLEATGIPGDKIFVFPYGIDPQAFPKRPSRQDRKDVHLLYVGQLIQRKGIADLLAALKQLKSPHIKLTICTRGFFDARILKAFDGVNVDIRRNVNHQTLLTCMYEADLLVFPSLAEGFGFVILEAMQCGLPVMTTTNTCGFDLIEDGINGFIIPPAEPEILARRIEEVIADKNSLKVIGENAHHTATQYTWQRFRTEIVRKYCEVAE